MDRSEMYKLWCIKQDQKLDKAIDEALEEIQDSKDFNKIFLSVVTKTKGVFNPKYVKKQLNEKLEIKE